MAEQEKREKAIEEMYKELAIEGAENPHALYAFCIVAINAGYRKEEEVQKETAKRFLKMLYDMGIDRQTVETCGLYDVNGSELAKFVSQEFGVEVDE